MTVHSPLPARSRQATSIDLDPHLVEEAAALGVDVSRACEDGLTQRIDKARRERQWLEENAEAIESWNAYVRKNGLPLADISVF